MKKATTYLTHGLRLTGAVCLITACSPADPFRLEQLGQNFNPGSTFNTKVDILWVVDNSPSMEITQSRLRAGVKSFAQKYLKPTWDIRLAAITTDSYLADSTFYQGPAGQPSYLTTVRSGTANYNLPYLNGVDKTYGSVTVPGRSKHYYDATSWVTMSEFPLFAQFEPAAYTPPDLTYSSAGVEKFTSAGLRIIDTLPQYGPDWAQLAIGIHDGPQLSMCWDKDSVSPQYLYGQTACYHRDDPQDPEYHVGIENCVSPGAGETGPSQCVNTLANNTVHTGKPLLSTMPPAGTPGDQAWVDQLTADFQVNLTPSTIGNDTERGFQSVLEFLKDNEPYEQLRFFRPGSLRVIVFVGDEDDQSQLPDGNQWQYGASDSYGGGTKAHFVAENASAPYLCKKTFSGANNGDFFPTSDPGYCVDPAWALPVTSFKESLDAYFRSYDNASAEANPNYLVVAITAVNSAGLQADGRQYITQRYPELVNEVGNGSLTLDISDSDYAPLLEQVGLSIWKVKSEFTLDRAPTGQEDMQVIIANAGGLKARLTASQYALNDKVMTITDQSVVSSLADGDQVIVNYQPKTVN